jgi:predicted  nucleic acid-binding Zn-ribbon protein
MNDSVTTLLNDLSAQLDCDVLTDEDTQRELNEEFSETKGRVATVADEIKQLANSLDARAFASKLADFLEGERAKALEANRLKEAIAERQARIAEAQDELSYLSAGRAALAEKVSQAMLALEDAQRDYASLDLRLGMIERSIESTRLERAELRRTLDELTRSKEASN